MGNGDNKAERPGDRGDQLAIDVACLYTWANVESVPYRDFSRQRKLHHEHSSLVRTDPSGGSANDKIAPVPDQSTEHATTSSEAAIADVLADFHSVSESANSSSIHRTSVETGPESITHPPEAFVPVKTISAPILIGPETEMQSEFTERDTPQSGGAQPVLGIYSLAGGVGKTTICANLGRALCFQGERVLLVDASGSGLLPFHFGANDLRPGLRTFVSPDMGHLPLQVIGTDEVTPAWLENDVRAAMGTTRRTIFDLGPASFSLVPKIFEMCTEILVPLLPNPNSILSISRIEHSLNKLRSEGNTIPFPYYVFNEFDGEHPRDMRARELVGGQCECGNRLLSLTICYGPEVDEAIASRMTVTDHAPESEVTRDFQNLTF